MQLNNWNVGKDFICLAIEDKGLDGDRVFSISVEGGVVEFTEGCDSYFNVKTTPGVAIAALLEAVDWIRAAALRQRPVVDDAMVERAWFAGMREYAKLTFGNEDLPDAIDLASMRAALLAAYQQDNGGQQG